MKKYRMTLEFTAENADSAKGYALAWARTLTADGGVVALVRLEEEYMTWCPIKLEERPRDSDG